MSGKVKADTNLGTAQLDLEKTIYAMVDEFCIKLQCPLEGYKKQEMNF